VTFRVIFVTLTQGAVCVHPSPLVLLVITASQVPGDMNLAKDARYVPSSVVRVYCNFVSEQQYFSSADLLHHAFV
jgi:hypothetical protein